MKYLICLIICLVASPAYGFDIEIRNNTDLKAVYWLYHVDHPFRDEYPAPFNFAGGELRPGKSSFVENREPGIYIFKWATYEDHVIVREEFYDFKVGAEVEKVTMRIPLGLLLETKESG